MAVLGIDIGNGHCVVAAVVKGGVDVILNEESKRETPTCIALGDRQRFMGAATAPPPPGTTPVSQIKRLIGRPLADTGLIDELNTLFPNYSDDGQGYPVLHFQYLGQVEKLSPTQLLGMLLGSLKRSAERHLSTTVSDCCIAVPAYFNDIQRRAVLQAAEIAGLNTLRLIHECSAAALEYSIYRGDLAADGHNRGHVVAIVDVGHSATQVAICVFRAGNVEILGRTANPNLGGRDFDEVLFKHFADELKAQNSKLDVSNNRRACARLRTACEKIKKVLSANPEASLNIESFIKDEDASATVTREKFEELCEPLLDSLWQTMERAATEAGLKPEDVDAVELIGSGSRVPALVQVVDEIFRQEPRRTLNASECIARGCALQASMLSPGDQNKPLQIRDKAPLGIYISWNQAIPKGSADNPPRFQIFTVKDDIPTSKTLRMNVKLDTSSRTATSALLFDKFELVIPNMQSTNVPRKDATPKIPIGSVCQDKISVSIYHKVPTKKNMFSFELVCTGNHTTALSTFQVGPFDLTQKGITRLRIVFKLNIAGMVSVDSVTSECFKGENRPEAPVPFIERVHGAFSKDALEMVKDKETEMAALDKQVKFTKDQKNSLESYVYETRNKLKNKYRDFATESGRKEFTKKLQEVERWLYEEGENVKHDAYAVKLKELKTLGDPIVARFRESSERDAAVDLLRRHIEQFYTSAGRNNLKYAHIDTQDKLTVRQACVNVHTWLQDNMKRQETLQKFQDPVISIEQLQSAAEDLGRVCNPILSKPPPPPPKPSRLQQLIHRVQGSLPQNASRQAPCRDDLEEEKRNHHKKKPPLDGMPLPHGDDIQNQQLELSKGEVVADPTYETHQLSFAPSETQYGFQVAHNYEEQRPRQNHKILPHGGQSLGQESDGDCNQMHGESSNKCGGDNHLMKLAQKSAASAKSSADLGCSNETQKNGGSLPVQDELTEGKCGHHGIANSNYKHQDNPPSAGTGENSSRRQQPEPHCRSCTCYSYKDGSLSTNSNKLMDRVTQRIFGGHKRSQSSSPQ